MPHISSQPHNSITLSNLYVIKKTIKSTKQLDDYTENFLTLRLDPTKLFGQDTVAQNK